MFQLWNGKYTYEKLQSWNMFLGICMCLETCCCDYVCIWKHVVVNMYVFGNMLLSTWIWYHDIGKMPLHYISLPLGPCNGEYAFGNILLGTCIKNMILKKCHYKKIHGNMYIRNLLLGHALEKRVSI